MTTNIDRASLAAETIIAISNAKDRIETDLRELAAAITTLPCKSETLAIENVAGWAEEHLEDQRKMSQAVLTNYQNMATEACEQRDMVLKKIESLEKEKDYMKKALSMIIDEIACRQKKYMDVPMWLSALAVATKNAVK